MNVLLRKLQTFLYKMGFINEKYILERNIAINKEVSYKKCNELWEETARKVHGDIGEKNISSMANRISQVLNLKDSDVILDIGAGDGRIDEYLKGKCKKILGFDFSASKVREAKNRNPECSYWNQSFLDKVQVKENIDKIFSFSVMQYCKPEDVKEFLTHQINICSQKTTIIHMDVPDKSKAKYFYKDFSQDLVELYKNDLRIIFDDGSYWHDLKEVKRIAESLGARAEILSDIKCPYRSDIVITVDKPSNF